MKANQTPRHLHGDERAISPIVATLMLILVAAGAAVGVNVWMKNFSGKATHNISTEQSGQTLKIGGSSTVWELTEKALPTWKSQYPAIEIINQEGGSAAGKLAICKGLVDIGAESSPFAATGGQPSLTTCPDLNGDGIKDPGEGIQIFKVGYDGVAMAFKAASCVTDATHGFTSAQVFALYERNGAGVSTAYPAIGTGTAIAAATTPITWADLVTAGSCVSLGSGVTGTNNVVLGSRQDPSGTEDGFCKRVLGQEKTAPYCTNDSYDQLDSSHYSNTCQTLTGTAATAGVCPQLGNDGIRTWLNADAHRLSFIGFGSVAESGSGLEAAPLGTTGTTLVAPSVSSIKGAGGNAALPGKCSSQAPAGQYCATRALEYMTAGTPSATEQLFLDFMTQTLNNQLFNQAAGYVPLY
jgi:phosphate transport system substrate-binding protein